MSSHLKIRQVCFYKIEKRSLSFCSSESKNWKISIEIIFSSFWSFEKNKIHKLKILLSDQLVARADDDIDTDGNDDIDEDDVEKDFLKMTQFVFCTNVSQFSLRRSSLAKFGLLVTVMTFCAMKTIIVDDLEDWGQETPRDVSRYIFPAENSTIVYPRILQQKFKKKLDFLLVVTSDPRHSARRDAIRRTWGSSHNQDSPLRMGVIFLMGVSPDPQVRPPILMGKQRQSKSVNRHLLSRSVRQNASHL